jgi:hypothetical protein
MTPRLITLLGRIGSIIIVIGLALALVSIIPSVRSRNPSTSHFTIEPEKYSYNYTGIYSPQAGLTISMNSSNSLQLYLLSADPFTMVDWVRTWITENFPTLNGIQVGMGLNNASVFEAFLQTHQKDVLFNETVEGELSMDFFPPKISNMTLVVSNPSITTVNVDIETTGIVTLVSRERITMPMVTLITSGIILVIPWAISKNNLFKKLLRKPS